MDPLRDLPRSIERYWTDPEWLGLRMLFLSGPRQVGKTTLITSRLCRSADSYFNWDNPGVRSRFRHDPDFFARTESEWICFDEIHKRPQWKNILKGVYDTHKDRYRFVISGSARLETFKKSGDSLVGRYFHTHLFPLNLADLRRSEFSFPRDAAELLVQAGESRDVSEVEELLKFGGFPEPFLKGSEIFWKRWSAQHRELVLQEDLRDLSRVVEIDKIEHLLEMLQPRAGGLVSYRNLALDLETTHGSVRRWLELLHRLHLLFPVPPYSKRIRRAFRQEKKWYFVDWSAANTNRFENYVAASLLRAAQLYLDRFGEKMSLHFVRTHDGTEVDFLLCRDGKPWLLIEAKEGTPAPTRPVFRFARELGVPAAVVTREAGRVQKIQEKGAPSIFSLSWTRLGQLLP